MKTPLKKSDTQLTEASFLILLSLAEKPMHGYLVMQTINTVFDISFKMSAGTLYRTLQRLIVAGLIEEIALGDMDPEDDRRRGYAVTDQGKLAAHDEMVRIKQLLKVARVQLEGVSNDV
jgi:DNA-binding PadR family transcriptional regulator